MSSAHVTPVKVYLTIFALLLLGTFVTVIVAAYDFGRLNTPVALAIACSKATLVIWFFMGVRYNTSLTKVTVASGFVWLLILFGIGMSDYLSRSWMGVPGR